MSDHFISNKDKALFRQMMQGVKPLQQSNKTRVKSAANKTVPVKRQPLDPFVEPPTLYTPTTGRTVTSEESLSFGKNNISLKQYKLLKNGQMRSQAKLDLHGLRTDSAQSILHQFITQQHILQNRCVLIIHGKGGHDGSPPALKNLVNHYLQQMPQILAFHSAVPKDGGNGALYVLLRRQ